MELNEQEKNKFMELELSKYKAIVAQQKVQLQELREQLESVQKENQKLKQNFIKVSENFSKELKERSVLLSETENNQSPKETKIDIFEDLRHSRIEEQSMRNIVLHYSNVKDEIRNNLSCNEENDTRPHQIKWTNIPNFKRSGSLTKNKFGNSKIKATKYDEFIDNLVLRDKKDKIVYLMNLCAPLPKQKRKIQKQKSLSQSTSRSFLKPQFQEDQSKSFRIQSQRQLLKLKEQEILSARLQNLKFDYSLLVNEFYIIDAPKKHLQDYISGKDLIFQIAFSSNPKSQVLTEEKIKFFTPFNAQIFHKCIENKISELNQNLFGDEADKKSQQFFCVALNSKDPSDYNAKEVSFIDENFPILKQINSETYHYFYVLKVDDFFVNEGDDLQLTDFINFYYHPKYYVFQTFYPFTNFFKQLLVFYAQQVKKKRMEKFIKIITKDKVDLQIISRIDSFNLISQEIQIFNQMQTQLKPLKIDNSFQQEFFLDFKSHKVNYKIPDKKFLPYSEAENNFEELFKLFTYEEFLFIILNILSEKNVVFVSQENEKLSAAISAFTCLLKPFKWPFPKIYSLPQDCLMMISSPVPVLIGLNTQSKQVLKEIIPSYWKCLVK